MLARLQDEINTVTESKIIKEKFSSIDKGFFCNLPTTRYYGSKRRIVPWLYENIKDLDFNTSLDAFGGTATVSLLLKKMGKQVVYNDGLVFNSLAAKALLSNELPFKDSFFQSILSSVVPAEGVISRNFKNKFYTEKENMWLDGFVSTINGLPEVYHAFFYYCVFQACLQKRPYNLFHRANLYLRQNKVERSFGNLSTWNSPFEKLVLQSFDELKRTIWDSGTNHVVLEPTDALDLKPNFDFVYIDPPYIGINHKNDNYLKKYHFLEGMCRYGEWESLMNKQNRISDILDEEEYAHIKRWNRKTYFKEGLYQLIHAHKNSVVALSYVGNAYPSSLEILKFFKDNFKNVKYSSYLLPHALSKGLKNELLFIGIP